MEVAFEAIFADDLNMLAVEGVLAHYGATQASYPIPIYALMSKGITLRFLVVYAMSAAAHAAAVRDISAVLRQKQLRVHVAKRFSLENLAAAHAWEDSGQADGKILVRIDPAEA